MREGGGPAVEGSIAIFFEERFDGAFSLFFLMGREGLLGIGE